MSDIATIMKLNFLHEAKEKNNTNVIHAHLQVIHKELNNFFTDEFIKEEAITIEFCKSITLFDQLTNSLKLASGVYGHNFIPSHNFYLDALSSCKKFVPSLYQGDMSFSCIPLKLRLAIEIYIKNMIGYSSSTQKFNNGKRKGQIIPYPLSIADLLSFLSDAKYSKYVSFPIELSILKDINFWSNNLMHTGIISFAWQNLTAIELLKPLFNTQHENGCIDNFGFNYLSSNHDQITFEKDLNNYLSAKTHYKMSVFVKFYKFKDKPIEGSFYHSQI